MNTIMGITFLLLNIAGTVWAIRALHKLDHIIGYLGRELASASDDNRATDVFRAMDILYLIYLGL